VKAEQEEIIKALKMALQMEIDGKEFYLKSARNSSSTLGKKLYKTLARAEDEHLKRFKRIFLSVEKKEDWPITIPITDESKAPDNIFALVNWELDNNPRATESELEAVQIAISMESKSYDFYLEQHKKTRDYPASEYYQALADEEKDHFLLLLDYQEYLTNPASYFTETEHSSLDGG